MSDKDTNERQGEDLQNPQASPEAAEQPKQDEKVIDGMQDAATLNEFDKTQEAEAYWQQGIEQFKGINVENLLTQSPLDFDKTPGLQIGELDELAVNLGFLMTQALKENSELDANGFRAWLQQNSQKNTVLKESAGYLEQAFESSGESSRDVEMDLAQTIREGFPGLFGVAKEAIRLLEENKDNPNFLADSLAYLEKQRNDVVHHPEGIMQGAVDKGYEAATGIWEFTKKNSTKLAATALIVGGSFAIGKWLFGDKEGATNSADKKSSGGFWKSILSAGALSFVGSELITKLWGGKTATEWVTKQIEKLTENITGKITEAVGTKIKAPLISALSVVMGEEEAKKTVDDIFAQFTGDKKPESTSATEKDENKQEALLGTVGSDVEWLEKTVGFAEKKAAIIAQIQAMGIEAPEWLQKLSPQEMISALGIDEVKNSTVLWNTGKYGALGYMLYKYATLRGVAINAGLYLFFIREGEHSWAAKMAKESLQKVQTTKEKFLENVSDKHPQLASALDVLDIDLESLSPHINSLTEYAKANPVTTLAAANATWLFRGILWSAIKTAGAAFRNSLIFAAEHPMATAATATIGFAYRQEIVDFLIDKAIPFDAAEAPQSKEWFRKELYQLVGETDESPMMNHTQDIIKSLTEDAGEVAFTAAEIAQEVVSGNFALEWNQEGKVVLHTLMAGNPLVQVTKLAYQDMEMIVENILRLEGSEGNPSTIWLAGEGIVFSSFAYRGWRSLKSITEAGENATEFTKKTFIRRLKVAGFPFTAESRFVVRSMFDFQTFANYRMSLRVGRLEGILGNVDKIMSNGSFPTGEKITKVVTELEKVQSILPADYAVKLDQLKGGVTHQSLELYRKLGGIQKRLNDLHAALNSSASDAFKVADISKRISDVEAIIKDYKTFASGLQGRWIRMMDTLKQSALDSPQKLKAAIGGLMNAEGAKTAIPETAKPTAPPSQAEAAPKPASANENVPSSPKTTPPAGAAKDPKVSNLAEERAKRAAIKNGDIYPGDSGGARQTPLASGASAVRERPNISSAPDSRATVSLKPEGARGGSAMKVGTNVLGTAEGATPGTGNTLLQAQPEAAPTERVPNSLSAEKINSPLASQLEAANENLAKKLGQPLSKVSAVAQGLERIMTPAMVATVLNDIARSSDPGKAIIEQSINLSLIYGFGKAGQKTGGMLGGGVGGLIGLLTGTATGIGATIIGAENLATAKDWTYDQLLQFGKQNGVDIRTFESTSSVGFREGVRIALDYTDPINLLADPLFEKMGFSFAMGNSAAEFFGETEPKTVKLPHGSLIVPMPQHGSKDVAMWNEYAGKQIANTDKKIADTEQKLNWTDTQKAQYAAPIDGLYGVSTDEDLSDETLQKELNKLKELKIYWEAQQLDGQKRPLPNNPEQLAWLDRESNKLRHEKESLTRVRELLVQETPFRDVMQRVDDDISHDVSTFATPAVRKIYDAVANEENIKTAKSEEGMIALFEKYISLRKDLVVHFRAVRATGLAKEDALSEFAEFGEIADANPNAAIEQPESPMKGLIN